MAEDADPVTEHAEAQLIGWLRAELIRTGTPTMTYPVYHYTDSAGLNGIFESGEVWFTSILHQNDPSEMEFGLTIAFDEMRKFASGSDSEKVRLGCDTLVQMIEQTLPKNLPIEYFVASFSEDEDELGQWRGYGNDGRGYSIGFSPAIFAVQPRAVNFPLDRLVVQRVIYDENAARSALRPVIKKTMEIFKSAMESVDSPEVLKQLSTTVAAFLCTDIIYNALAIKHKAYSAEREVRLLVAMSTASAQGVSIRSRGARLIPFHKVPLPILSPGNVVKIVIGPAWVSEKQEAEHAVRLLLSRYNLSSTVAITHSSIPYRSLRG